MANPLTPHTPALDRKAEEPAQALPPSEFARLWLMEVPKVVARHQEERLRVRRELGFIG